MWLSLKKNQECQEYVTYTNVSDNEHGYESIKWTWKDKVLNRIKRGFLLKQRFSNKVWIEKAIKLFK